MGDISLADVARALDAMLDDQMTGQARIAAHLVAAAEAAGHGPERVIETLSAVVSATVLDECWITDGEGVACITTVRDASGAPVPFRFSPDPAVQPQASAFHPLLSSDPESDDVVAQGAQVREIDNEVFKYVGVVGVDRRRIRDGATRVADHPTGPRPADGALWKYVTVADADMPRLVQVGLPIADSSPVSPRFGEARRA